MRQMIENFGLRNTVETLHQAGLHPDVVSNHLMDEVFEELVRRFNEASNENPGEHFAPRDVVRLMVDLLLAGDDDFVKMRGRIVKVYDPCCSTGGMLPSPKRKNLRAPPTRKQ